MEKTTQESQNVPVIAIPFTFALDGIMDLLKQMSDGEVYIIPEDIEKSGSCDPYKFSTALAEALTDILGTKKEVNTQLIIYVANWVCHSHRQPGVTLYYSWAIHISGINKTWSKSAYTIPVNKDSILSQRIIWVSFT